MAVRAAQPPTLRLLRLLGGTSPGVPRLCSRMTGDELEPRAYRQKLGRLDGLLWETAERLDEVVVEGEWPPAADRLSEVVGVLLMLAVTLDDLALAVGTRE
jgi:hypothetical protein